MSIFNTYTKILSFVLIALITLTPGSCYASNNQETGGPQYNNALVVCNSRSPGGIGDTAAYCHKPKQGAFVHLDLAKRVVSIDIQDLSLEAKTLLSLRGHQHICADAREYKFDKENFDLIFMELPPSYSYKVMPHERLKEYRSGEFKRSTGLIPQMIRNLAPSLKVGCLLQIEHIPYSEHLERWITTEKKMFNTEAIKYRTRLRKEDPFTLYHTRGLDAVLLTLPQISANVKMGNKRLADILLDEKLIRFTGRLFIENILPFHFKMYEITKEADKTEHKQAIQEDIELLSYLPKAIRLRAKNERVFPEVIARIVESEVKLNFHQEYSSYTNTLLIYAHMLYLQNNIGILKSIFEPLGLEDVSIYVRDKSHNGRPFVWWIEARKK